MPDTHASLDQHRDEKTIKTLQDQKFATREKLRAARIEMGLIDQKLFKAGALAHDIGMVCW